MIKTTLLPLVLLAACETTPKMGIGNPAATPEIGLGNCDATRVQNFIGALGTADLGTALLKRSGARTIRWLAPNTMATMDYRSDRLNVLVNERNFVTGVHCG